MNGSVRADASKMRRTGMPQPPPDRWWTIISAERAERERDPVDERQQVRPVELPSD